jgi:hypothetical protein
LSFESPLIVARFRLHLRCQNCRGIAAHILDVPDGEDAPRDVEELATSQILGQVKFSCEKCEGNIGIVINADPIRINADPHRVGV